VAALRIARCLRCAEVRRRGVEAEGHAGHLAGVAGKGCR
jgi:hypothetical protein